MAEFDIYKRKLFGGLGPDEYSQLVDYARDFQTGGIDRLNVNRGVTAEDVLRATSPLSDPVAPGATSSVAKFNDFLANILGAKSQRIAGEEDKIDAANTAAVAAVTEALQPVDEKDNYMVVNDQLVDIRTLDDKTPKTIDFRTVDEDEKQVIKLTGGVEMTMDQFDTYSQDQKNQLLGLDTTSGETFKETFITDEGKFGAIIEDKLGNVTTKIFDFTVEDEVGDGSTETERFRARQTELLLKKENEGLSQQEEIELKGINEELTDQRTYETSAEKKWGEVSTDLIMSTPKKQDALFKVNQVSQKLFDKDINTGILTPKATVLQEILEPLGVDLKGILDFANIDILNEASDSAIIDALGTQFGIAASDQLAGQISERELVALFNTTIRLSAPGEFNREFAKGLNYLLTKDLAASQIAARGDINSAQEWALAMEQWKQENPAPYMFSGLYEYEGLSDLNLDLNLGDPRDEGSD
jgi:hypothetical protein